MVKLLQSPFLLGHHRASDRSGRPELRRSGMNIRSITSAISKDLKSRQTWGRPPTCVSLPHPSSPLGSRELVSDLLHTPSRQLSSESF